MTIWGKSVLHSDTNIPVNGTWMCPGTFFGLTAYRLRSFEIYIVGPDTTAELRLAVYRGGTTDNPNGATLVEDLFLTNSGSAIDQWWTVNSALKPVFNSGEQVWLCFKGNDNTFRVKDDFQTADRGDLSIAGAVDISSVYSADEFVVWPASIAGSFSPTLIYFNVRINVDQHANVTSPLTFVVQTQSQATAFASCSTTVTFAATASIFGLANSRAHPSIIFAASGVGALAAVASCSATMRLAVLTATSGAPVPCWDGEVCLNRPFSVTARLTATLNEV